MLIGIVVSIIVVGTALGVTGFTNRLLGPLRTHDTFESSESATAPELAAGNWINSEALKLKDLRGRVVLIEFWTFGCYNCRNTLPSVKGWDDRYRDKGLTVVGVHSPEFDNERKLENVRREVASLGIRYPVVTDNDYQTWRAYNVEAWPTIFLLDKEGQIRWKHVGEGAYDEAEQTIKKLLAEEDKQPEDKSKREKAEKAVMTAS
jgi:thiol-disulfide isomerase/thioredoxin